MEVAATRVFVKSFLELILVLEQTRYRFEPFACLAKDQPLPFQQESVPQRPPLQEFRLVPQIFEDLF
jgi:hypothetical protein